MRYNTLYPPKSQWGSNGGQRQKQKKKTSVKSEVFVVRETGLESSVGDKFESKESAKMLVYQMYLSILENYD